MKKLFKKIFYIYLKFSWGIESMFDKYFIQSDVPISKKVSHKNWQQYLYQIGNKQGMII